MGYFFGWDVLDYPPYSPDLEPSNFHLVWYLKNDMGGKNFYNDEVKSAVKSCLLEQAINF